MFGKLFVVAASICILAFLYVTFQADKQATVRIGEQAQLLDQLEAVHTSAASQLVDDLRNAYPHPSEEDISRLRLLVQRVKTEPATAAKYTLAAKQAAQAKSACHQIQSVVTGNDLCGDLKPGLD